MNVYGMETGNPNPGNRIAIMIKRITTAIDRAGQPRKPDLFKPSQSDMEEGDALKSAFEAKGYRFRTGPDTWRVEKEGAISASSQSCLRQASESMMMMEALGAAARAEWIQRHGSADMAAVPLSVGCGVIDIATGLCGTVERIDGPYAVVLSEALSLDMPGWAWKEIPGALEGDRIRLHTVTRSLAHVDASWTERPWATWGAVVSAANRELVPTMTENLNGVMDEDVMALGNGPR